MSDHRKPEIVPSEHRSPYPRIDINPRHPVTVAVPAPGQEILDQIADAIRANEAARIWKITRAVAEGTNPPTVGQE